MAATASGAFSSNEDPMHLFAGLIQYHDDDKAQNPIPDKCAE